MGSATVAQDQHSAMGIKPIETRAYGHRFRSRLEARWAVAFTEARIAWQYEPEGFDLGNAGFYLPDFWLPQVSMWAEVKANRPSEEELLKIFALARHTKKPCLILVGLPSTWAYWAYVPANAYEGEIVAGSADTFCLFEGSDYHIDEGRFYSNCGYPLGVFSMPFDLGYGLHPAVEAALSARFEHGESPR